MSRLSYCISALLISPISALSLGLPSLALQYNPPNRGAPGYTRNAGSRTGPCGDLTAVQPTQTNWGETLVERPTFGIYVAEPTTDLTFELKDERSQEILHRATFDHVAGPGISLYTLPDTAPALEPNQFYRWQVSLECEQFNSEHIQYTGSKTAGGMIVRRLASDPLPTTLATATADEKPALLASHGLWYDAVHALLLQSLEHPETETWTDAWQTLIAHPMVQLNHLTEAVPIDCCLAAACPETADTASDSP